jgi:hypothetical protein
MPIRISADAGSTYSCYSEFVCRASVIAAVAVLVLTACGGSHRGTTPPLSKTHTTPQLLASQTRIEKSGPECASQHLITGWTLLLARGHHPCAPSAHVQHVFRAYLGNAACLRRPAPNGTWCVATDGYRCVTWNWQGFPGVKTMVDCVARTGPKAATFFTAWSPQARH